MYINYQQDDWLSYLPLAKFAYNNSTQASIKMTPFFANYGFDPSLRFTIFSGPFSISQLAKDHFKNLRKLHTFLQTEILHAQQAQQRNYNTKHIPSPNYQSGDKVWLLRKYIRTERPSSKLDSNLLGPFEVLENIRNTSFRLRLPSSMKIHPVFHISLLESVSSEPPLRKVTPSLDPVVLDDQEEFEVETIIASKRLRKKLYYLIH